MHKNNSPTLCKVNNLKRAIYLIAILTISSCTISKYYSDQPGIANRIEAKEIIYLPIGGHDYTLNKIYYSDIEKCINENENVHKYFRDAQDAVGEINESRLSNLTAFRKVIKRGNLSLGLPERFRKIPSITKTKLCVNTSGSVTMARIVESNLDFQVDERDIFLACLLDYTFESDTNANCL